MDVGRRSNCRIENHNQRTSMIVYSDYEMVLKVTHIKESIIKETDKMKIGDRAVMIRDYYYVKKGMTGKVVQAEFRGLTDTLCTVEFDQPFEGGHTYGGYAPSGRGYRVPASALKILDDDKNWKIIITANGDATTAKLIQDGKRIKEVSVNRYFKDEYNAEVGAKEAISKLFKFAGHTGKAVCYNDSGCSGFAKGKIYTFCNGSCIDDNDKFRPAESLANLFDEHFVKIQE